MKLIGVYQERVHAIIGDRDFIVMPQALQTLLAA